MKIVATGPKSEQQDRRIEFALKRYPGAEVIYDSTVVVVCGPRTYWFREPTDAPKENVTPLTNNP